MSGTSKLYSLKDICIIPNGISNIKPYNINIYYNNTLPLFTFPSSDIVTIENISLYEKNKITPIIPSDIDLNIRYDYLIQGKWVELKYNELKLLFTDKFPIKEYSNIKICIKPDTGYNMLALEYARELKTLANKHHIILYIMYGPIYDLNSFKYIKELNNIFNNNVKNANNIRVINYLRIGPYNEYVSHYKGLTTILTYIKNNKSEFNPQIIVDSNEIKSYTDIATSLILGANYVMCKDMFIPLLESGINFDKSYKFKIIDKLGNTDEDIELQKIEFLSKYKNKLYKNSNVCTQTITQWTIGFEKCLKTFLSDLNCSDIRHLNTMNITYQLLN